ncbi:hypothetical protein GCM10008986_13750 [Salinibacillus aidingensis]|uniref:Uncharacterized protein n=1 Tax=Salinibacillus aidingensis TaxID=237684 RepID=A0ABN1B4V8_9BACI
MINVVYVKEISLVNLTSRCALQANVASNDFLITNSPGQENKGASVDINSRFEFTYEGVLLTLYLPVPF